MLQIQHLTITLNENFRTILKDFTFTLNPGDRAVIIGEEGNGKSTLLKLIADPALVEGYASFHGAILRGGSRLGYLAQELTPQEKELSAYEYLLGQGAFESSDAGEAAQAAVQLRLPLDTL